MQHATQQSTVYQPEWSFDACGCIAPEEVEVLPNGRAIAHYRNDPSVPYASLEALVDAHEQGGDLRGDELRARLGEPEQREYRAGTLFETLRRALPYYGRGAVAAGYVVSA